MSSTRRAFLKTAAGSVGVVGAYRLAPQVMIGAVNQPRSNDRVLVVVQLAGGNDGLNTVVPFGNDAYYENRYSLAISKSSVLKIDDELGLHPEMRGCAQLLQDGCMTVINGVGYEQPNRSHFESMDLWHTAHLSDATIKTGWLGRYADQVGLDVPAIHFGSESQPLALASESTRCPSLETIDEYRFRSSEQSSLHKVVQDSMTGKRDGASSLLTFVQQSEAISVDLSNRLDDVVRSERQQTSFPQTGLGRKLSDVARMIGADIPTRVFYVTLDGFDTHANQSEAHAGLLRQFSDAVASFMKAMKEQGNAERVLLMAFSEFGRRLKENASLGTDHGAAAPVFLFGGNVRPGVIGAYPSLHELQDGDLKYHTDYRRVYATCLDRWLETPSERLLGGRFKPVDALKADERVS